VRYTDPKDRSAELLRIALGHMGRHAAAFNPLTFTLWYEYAAGTNHRLSRAVDERVGANAPIDDAAVEQLYTAHIAPSDTAAVERIGGELQRVITGIESSASQAGTSAGLFGAQLDGLSAALRAADPGALAPHLDAALTSTATMRRSAEALQQLVAASQSEIARLRVDLDRARDEALLDPLTGILNRKGLDQKIEALLRQPPASGRLHCLLLFDIDHFKQVNDVHGHVMGDRVIQGLGEILRQCASGAAQVAARYGGEEFAIVLPDALVTEATAVAEQVRERAKAMRIRKRNTQEVLFSITVSGGATALMPGDDATAFIARADAALYESKKTGRDRISVR